MARNVSCTAWSTTSTSPQRRVSRTVSQGAWRSYRAARAPLSRSATADRSSTSLRSSPFPPVTSLLSLVAAHPVLPPVDTGRNTASVPVCAAGYGPEPAIGRRLHGYMDDLGRLLVRSACTEVITRYAIAVNAWDLDAFVALFTEDAV